VSGIEREIPPPRLSRFSTIEKTEIFEEVPPNPGYLEWGEVTWWGKLPDKCIYFFQFRYSCGGMWG